MTSLRLLPLVTLTVWSLSLAAQNTPPADIVANGSFEVLTNGWAAPWQKGTGASIAAADGRHWLRLEGGGSTSGQRVDVRPEWWQLRLTMRMKSTAVVLGDESWKNARLAMSFHAADGTRVGNWPDVFNAVGTSDWTACDRVYAVPRGAAYLALSPANFGTEGSVEFDDIRLAVVKERVLTKADAPLPEGMGDPWAPGEAWQVDTGTQGRLCLNGLWAFRPVVEAADAQAVPAAGDCWGWFKVPGIWPSAHWRLREVAQVVHLAPWLDENLDTSTVDQAWYRRPLTLPPAWSGRRVWLEFTMVQTHAAVYVDGQRQGEVWFPGGCLDLTAALRDGAAHQLAVLLTARPMESDSLVFMAPDRIVQTKASVKLKGLTGDVFLCAAPAADAVADVAVIPSVRDGTIGFDVGVAAPQAERYRLAVEVSRAGQSLRRFESDALALQAGRLAFTAPWPDAPQWDTDQPDVLLSAAVTLLDPAGKVFDRAEPVRFGFREFRIDGRDFRLNGTPIHLRALHNSSSNGFADRASRDGARETLRRMREYGFNFLIQGNYDAAPGEVSYVDGLLEACDETGMLLSVTLPHAKDFGWKLEDPAQAERYRTLCAWIIRRVRNHPAVVMYAMNHNATGYYGDQNPLKIDGLYDPDALAADLTYKGDRSRARRRTQALTAAQMARAVDPTRPIYHHQSGNLGDMHTVNIYLNWAPLQERSDWLAHWSSVGRKPLFFVEWGLPHISSWSSYRGPEFIWRCQAFQSAWVSEFAAAYLGTAAYGANPGLRKVLDEEEALWAKGAPFAWSTLAGRLREADPLHTEIMAQFADDNWRAHRTWGISAMLPWDQEHLWQRVAPTLTSAAPARYRNLQQPGIVPDANTAGSQYIYDGGPAEAFAATALGRSFLRWNQPLCAFIGGRTDGHSAAGPSEASERRFTEKRHTVAPGDTVAKSLVILNDTRRPRTCSYRWELGAHAAGAQGRVEVAPGSRAFVPIAVPIPAAAAAGALALSAEFDFGDDDVQRDAFEFTVLPAVAAPAALPVVWLLDPAGATAAWFDRLGVRHQAGTAAGAEVKPGDVLVVGEGALSTPELASAALPVLGRAAEGVRVLVLAQSAEVLSERLGFRVNTQGLRQVYRRVPAHPALAGLGDAGFSNWAGAGQTVPPYLDVPAVEDADPRWSWCGFRNTRVWRCGSLGTVASVLIEKPSRGDWMPLLDGGFDLQYAVLLETAIGTGRVVFCQLDAVQRTESEPVAERVVRQLLAYLAQVPATPVRTVLYRGDPRGAELLQALGVPFAPCLDALPVGDLVIVAGPGSTPPVGVAAAVAAGANLLGLGLEAAELARWLPDGPSADASAPLESAPFDAALDTALAGVSDAELHWRTRPAIAALAGPGHPALRARRQGKGTVVLCQAAPWAFAADTKPYLRTTARRSEFLASRLLANLGAPFDNPVLQQAAAPASPWEFALPAAWVGREDREAAGRDAGWWRPEYQAEGWPTIAVPGTFETQRPALADYNGLFWYRLRFTAPESFAGDATTLFLGGIDDESWVWLNGEFLGEVTKATHPKDYWQFPREYRLAPGRLRPGQENVLAVLVNDTYQSGGIQGVPMLKRPGPWLRSYYVQVPQAGDDPYRYYRW